MKFIAPIRADKFLFFLLMFCPIYVLAQIEDFCGSDLEPVLVPPGTYSKSIDQSYLNNFEHRTFNIFYWRINKNDGSYTPGSWPLTLDRAKRSVDSLNYYFAPMNICFNLVGMDTINSTTHYTGSSLGAIKGYAQAKGKVHPNAFNVYCPKSLSRGSGQSGPHQTSIAIISAIVGSNSRTLMHEIGHCFNLIHTFGNSNDRPPVPCEHVTRDPDDPSYNADDLGDKVIDTNAATNFQREQNVYFANALVRAGITTWMNAFNLSKRENGFHNDSNAIAISQALAEYGFTSSEIAFLEYNAAKMDAYSDIENCAYAPDARIADRNSPFFKDCEGTPFQVTPEDYRNIMAYSNSDCMNQFTIGQMIRVHETINSYLNVFNTVMSDKQVDLYIKDTEDDIGQEPNIHTNVFWNSQDIWVRNQDDGLVVQEHQNPVYNPTHPNFVYIRIRNKGCGKSSGLDEVKLYWAKANTSLNWPDYWNGNIIVDAIPMGGELGAMTIPPINPGSEKIIKFEWMVPNPQDYIGINPNPWHFCLLSRVESADDPMTFQEGSFITENVKKNNNIGWKNTSIIEVFPHTFSIGAVIGISNPSASLTPYALELVSRDEVGKEIFHEAEVSVEMDDVLLKAWKDGNKEGVNFDFTHKENKIIASGNDVLIDNILLEPYAYGTAYISFNFLTKELTAKDSFVFDVIQKDKATARVMGGETFEIKKTPRNGFIADAGGNKFIKRNDSISLIARDILEDAEYNWFDSQGNLIESGAILTVAPKFSTAYKLEVISNLDGFKDYDDVLVQVKPYHIESISPNPVSEIVTISYNVEGSESAYLMIANQNTGIIDNYVLNTNSSSIAIDMSFKNYGWYSVILVCDGELTDSKNLGKY